MRQFTIVNQHSTIINMMILVNVNIRTTRQSMAELTVANTNYVGFWPAVTIPNYFQEVSTRVCQFPVLLYKTARIDVLLYLIVHSIVKYVKSTVYRVSKVSLKSINMINSVRNGFSSVLCSLHLHTNYIDGFLG